MTALASRIATTLIVAACGDNNSLPCDPEGSLVDRRPPGCIAALIFASRDTTGLIPSRSETDRYFDRWRKTIEREPVLELYIPQTYRLGNGPRALTVFTSNPTAIDWWSDGTIETGDPELDTIFERLKGVLRGPPNDGGTSHSVSFSFDRIYNEEYMARELAERDIWMDDPVMLPKSDGYWLWIDSEGAGHDNATAQIDFSFGWGDCFNGCIWMHHVRSIVPPDGPATVYDLGGDPLPEGWNLSPNTKPPP